MEGAIISFLQVPPATSLLLYLVRLIIKISYTLINTLHEQLKDNIALDFFVRSFH